MLIQDSMLVKATKMRIGVLVVEGSVPSKRNVTATLLTTKINIVLELP